MAVIISNPPGPYAPSWDSLENYVTPEWYMDAKFGIFIHWGVYSVPAFLYEWYRGTCTGKAPPNSSTT